MFRRKPTPAGGDDPLLTADLPTRVEAAHSRLAHQDDPALQAALSVRELAEERGVAERVREHGRTEQLADLEMAEETAASVRKAAAAVVRTEARDLVTARQALAALRRESSPHAQLAELYREKKLAAMVLSGVVLAMMLFSATNVQHNLAPGGPSEPLYWMSYLLEAGLSAVLVMFMRSGSAVARWGITDSDTGIHITEVALLLGSIYLNVFPYMHARGGWDWQSIAAHGMAPVAMGVALVAHGLIAKRLGAAIAKASALMPADAEDDTAARLAALTRVVPGVQHSVRAADSTPVRESAPEAEEEVLAEYERELAPRTTPALEAEEVCTWLPPQAASADLALASTDLALGDADASADAPHYTSSTDVVGTPHFAGADSADGADFEITAELPAFVPSGTTGEEQVIEAAPVAAETPAPARTAAAPAPSSSRAARPHQRPHPTPRTTPALSGAGPVARTALALAPVQSADLVRADLPELAHEVRAQRVGARLPFETVVRVLEMVAAGETPNAIHEETGAHHKTIGNIHETALRCAAHRVGGSAQVIALRKTDR
ncbi:hypothetical protein ACFXPR_36620 [Nocardia tengchongensis]|uniref:hypothetical protein n=1 Tax=Nocardia tengchongensis TaxID=2055889 RepID=UPI0036B2A379